MISAVVAADVYTLFSWLLIKIKEINNNVDMITKYQFGLDNANVILAQALRINEIKW